jgi:hypothetical protein
MMNGFSETIRFDQAQGWSRNDPCRLKGLLSSRRPFGGPERDGEWKKFGRQEALLYGRVAIHERESLQFRRRHEHDYPKGTVVRVQRAPRHKNNALCHQPLEVAEVLTDDRHLLVGGAFDQHGRSDRFMAVKELLHQRVQIRFVSIVKQTIGPQFEPCRINMQRLKLK